MLTKILIANRGEICCRIAATARGLGIRTVAIYSDADREAKHVAACDEAVGIGGITPTESYLSIESVLRAARATGVQAIHPGYGFLAENAEFAEACARAGFIFIGPSPAAIRLMGDKSAAKSLMANAGIPIIPGYHGEHQETEFLRREAEAIGYPILVKARAGGGGKGMRKVEQPADFDNALSSCRREAKSSFGDDGVLIEKYVSTPRHIEIQIFGDSHGNYLHLFERDCSVQRRHQKVVEEAPAPGITDQLRRAMGETAIKAARAAGYIGAGTVEFIVDPEWRFYFMEMNTRLQVEHPVTEMITGQDLVEWQLQVAAGAPLPLSQEQLMLRGHAIEARLYAEKPGNDFLPSTGKLRVFRGPPAIHFSVPPSPDLTPVRLDSGVEQGDTMGPHYDPLLAKLIAWGQDRADAIQRLQDALNAFVVLGLETNLSFLQRLVHTADFVAANLDTGLIARNEHSLLRSETVIGFTSVALATAALLEGERSQTTVDNNDPYSPWAQTSGRRLNSDYTRSLFWLSGSQEIEAVITYPRTDPNGTTKPRTYHLQAGSESGSVEIVEQTTDQLVILIADRRIAGRVYVHENSYDLFTGGEHITLHLRDPLAHSPQSEHSAAELTAPMPGRIVAVLANEGQSVTKGTPMMVMEAMKMEHTIVALADGKVDQVLFAVGDQVSEGAQLIRFTQGNSKA